MESETKAEQSFILTSLGKYNLGPDEVGQVLTIMSNKNIPLSDSDIKKIFVDSIEELKRSESIECENTINQFSFISENIKFILEDMLERKFITDSITQQEKEKLRSFVLSMFDKMENLNMDDMLRIKLMFEDINGAIDEMMEPEIEN